MRPLQDTFVVDLPPDTGLNRKAPGFERLFAGLAIRRENLKLLGQVALLNGILVGFFLYCFAPAYETNDDLNMQFIASGFFTGHPSAHLVFTNVLIGWPLKLCYQLWNSCNWYLIYVVAVHYASLTAIAFVILNRRNHWAFVILYIGFFLLAETRNLLNLQFTTTAFLAGTAGVLLLVDAMRPGCPIHWKQASAGFFLFALTGLIREQVAPFLTLVAFPFFLERFGSGNWRRLLLVALGCTIPFLGCQGLNRWYYQRDPVWREFLEYNRLRAEIHDTPLQKSLSQAAQKAGWSQNDAWLFSQDYFADPEVFGSASKLRVVVDELRRIAPPIHFSDWLSPADLWLPRVWGGDAAFLAKFALLTSVALLFFAGPRRSRWFVTLALLYVVFVAVTAYLRATARLPQRVSYNMPLLMLAICLYWLTEVEMSSARETAGAGISSIGLPLPVWLRTAKSRLGWFLPVALIWIFSFLSLLPGWARALWYTGAAANYLQTETDPKLFQLLHETLPPGQKPILVPIFWDAPLEQCLFFHPYRKDVPFSLLPYSWLPHSPLYREALQNHKLQPYALSLLDRKEVFFLMGTGWVAPLETFYREHHGLNIHFKQVIDTDQMLQFRDCRLYLYQGYSETNVARKS